MPITPISSKTFKHKRFKRYDSYAFAAKDVVVPLVMRELVRASVAMPIAFARIEDCLVPVAIQGFEGSGNLFVTTDGRWIGRYVPSVYRGYPFSLANDGQGRELLCFDDSSGLLVEEGGEPFFTDGGKPTRGLNDVLNFLTQVASNRRLTEKVCALLHEQGLLEPWPIKFEERQQEQTGGQQAHVPFEPQQLAEEPTQEILPERPEKAFTYQLSEMFRVNETAFAQLGKDEVHALHQAGALAVIYCQLMSIQHLPAMVKLAQAHRSAQQKAALPKNEAGELDLSFLADDTTISFEDFQD